MVGASTLGLVYNSGLISSGLSSLACSGCLTLMRCVRPSFSAAACAVALAGRIVAGTFYSSGRLKLRTSLDPPSFCLSHSVFACTVRPGYYNFVYLLAHSCLRRTSKRVSGL